METLTDIFSHVCGRGRCFEAGGAAWIVCQRCAGLYIGAVLTAGWLFACGIWRRGLPPWRVFLAHLIVLIGGMLGGTGVIELGAAWRVICGLWTGHVSMVWLIGGGQHLLLLARGRRRQLPWRGRDKVQGLVAPALLAAIGVAIASVDTPALLGWWAPSIVVAVGAVCLAAAVALAIAGVLWWSVAGLSGAGALSQQEGADTFS